MAFRRKMSECKDIKTAKEAIAVARRFHDMGGTQYERELQESRTERIREKMLGGEHVLFNLASGTVLENNLTSRVDGQHTTELFLELTEAEWKEVRFPIGVVISEFECDTPVDLATLFEQFNPPWSSRTAQDLIGCHLAVHPELFEAIPRSIAAKLAIGLAWYLKKVRKQEIHPATKYELIHSDPDHQEFMLWSSTFLRVGKVEDTLRPPVIAAMFHTTRTGDEKMRAFWKKVAGGTGHLDAGNIDYKLAEFLEYLRLTHNCKNKVRWPESVARYLDEGANPKEIDVFSTCLRAAEAEKRGRRIGEIFSPAKTKDASVIVQEMLPALVG